MVTDGAAGTVDCSILRHFKIFMTLYSQTLINAYFHYIGVLVTFPITINKSLQIRQLDRL